MSASSLRGKEDESSPPEATGKSVAFQPPTPGESWAKMEKVFHTG